MNLPSYRYCAWHMLSRAISRETEGFFGLDDLPDTPTVMNALDEIEGALKAIDTQESARLAVQWAREIVEDEGYLLFD